MRTLLAGLVAAAAATYLKTQAENVMQPVAERIWPPTTGQKSMIGADPADQPEKMPPAEIAAEVAWKTGRSLDQEQRERASAGLHWVMGLGFGTAYTFALRRWPVLGVGAGVPAGLALYAATHGSTLPAAGQQPPPWKMPPAAVAWEAGSHAVYGMALAGAAKVLLRL